MTRERIVLSQQKVDEEAAPFVIRPSHDVSPSHHESHIAQPSAAGGLSQFCSFALTRLLLLGP